EDSPRVFIVMHHPDGKRRIKRPLGDRQMLEIGLNELYVVEMAAESGGLFHGVALVGPQHLRSRFGNNLGIATAAATGIEHVQSRQFREAKTRLGFKGRDILIVMGDLISIPLEPE